MMVCFILDIKSSIQIEKYAAYVFSKMWIFFIIKRGIYWWGNWLLLVGNLEGLVGKIPTSLLVKKCPVECHQTFYYRKYYTTMKSE